MIIQNCLNILKDITNIEKQISIVEKQARIEDVEIDYKSLLSVIVKDITDK